MRVDPKMLRGFKWLPTHSLHRHERTNQAAITTLVNQMKDGIRTSRSMPTVPAVLACSRSLAIVGGHPFYEALTELRMPFVPTLLLDYDHKDILLRSEGMSKSDVVEVALSDELLEPGQAVHHVREAFTYMCHPLPVLSPTCPLIHPTLQP